MPLKRCNSESQVGWKWGDEGTCYTGPNAKKQAIKQGVAIEGPEKFSEKAIEADLYFERHEIQIVTDEMQEQGYSYVSQVALTVALTAQAEKIGGYPPNCNEGYKASEGRCIPKDSKAVIHQGVAF